MDIASTIFAVPMIVIIAILVFWGCFCKVTSFFDERSYLKKMIRGSDCLDEEIHWRKRLRLFYLDKLFVLCIIILIIAAFIGLLYIKNH